MKEDLIKKYWKKFLENPENNKLYGEKKYEAWHFDYHEESANKLAQLVINGTKRATASLYESFSYDNEDVPEFGDLSIILDWEGNPKCIIKTTQTNTYKFKDVPESFARIEGEGDKSLKYWKDVHNDSFKEEAERIGSEFTEDSIIFCEQFELIYKG